MKNKGFSLIEVMISILIVGILAGIAGSNFGNIRRTINGFIESTAFREQMLIFLLKLDEEYQQAEITNPSGIELLDQLTFAFDYNFDGDTADSGEMIRYRWNSDKSRIERKSGKGSYQSLLEGVTNFTWRRRGTDPPCHQMRLQTVYNPIENTIEFCRAAP
jgi:prepilin-type N-terminal cleavage/methylation domain-containing protein